MKEIIGYDKKYLVTGYDIQNMILLTNIEYLCTEQQGCWKSDTSFGEMILLGRQMTNKRIRFLRDEGWFEIHTINIKGGKKRTLVWLNKELQVSSSRLVQVHSSSIDKYTPVDNSIDNTIKEKNIEKNTKEISDGAVPEIKKLQQEKVSDGAGQRALVSDGAKKEFDVTPEIRKRFENSKEYRKFNLENSTRLYNKFLFIYQKQEENINQHRLQFEEWMLDQFIELRKKKHQPVSDGARATNM